MKSYHIFFGLLLFTLNTQAQTPLSTKTQSAITDILAIQEKSWNEGDINGFMKYYWHSDSLKFIGSSGLSYGWQTTLNNYKKSYPDKATMGILTYTVLSMEKLSKKSAFVIGKWHLQRTEDELSGHFSLVWKKINGNWLIVADHSS